jgi:ribosomal protein L37E
MSEDYTWHEEEAFECPKCGRRSYHPMDKRQGYCGACHDWTGKPL